jgi:hypothetical protein
MEAGTASSLPSGAQPYASSMAATAAAWIAAVPGARNRRQMFDRGVRQLRGMSPSLLVPHA